MMPIVSGTSIGLDNTCKAVLSLQGFFGGGSHSALNELNRYEAALIFDLSLFQEETPEKRAKEERLEQINRYITVLKAIKTNETLDVLNGHYPAYPEALKSLMAAHDSNLYSIQLRPEVQDVNLRTANPLFSVNRTNDADGNSLSCFYTALWDSFQHLKIQPQDTRSRLIKAVLASTEAQHRDFKGIQRVLTSQTKVLLGIDIDFTHSNAGEEITEDFIHQDLGNSCTLFIRKQRPEDINQLSGNYLLIEPHQLIYIHRDGREEPISIINTTAFQASLETQRMNALVTRNKALPERLKLKNPEDIQTIALTQEEMTLLTGYEPPPATPEDYVESLLGFCAPHVFETVVESPFYTINEVEKNAAIEQMSILTQFFLAETNVFCTSNRLSDANFGEVLDQSEDLSQEIASRIISIQSIGGSIENTLLDFINEHQTEFKLTQPLTSNDFDAIKKRFTEDYAEIKDSPHFDDFMLLDKSHPGLFVEHQGSIAIDFSEFAKSPELNIDSPDFEQTREEYKQLRQTGVIPHKNEHIAASIEVNLDGLDESELKALLDKLPLKNRLQLLKQMPELQLRLQQCDFLHHVAKGEQQQSEDILKNCPEIAQCLLTTSGQFTDYSGRTFNCTAYEYAYWAKDKHMCRMLESNMDDDTKAQLLAKVEVMEEQGVVYQQPDDQGVMQTKQSKHFDMTPLITALQEYVDGYEQWDGDKDYEAMKTAWMKVGIAQRDVPAHVVHEYCRPDRPFFPLPSFSEENLPRILTFDNHVTSDKSWFPLSSSSSGLGFDFALIRGGGEGCMPIGSPRTRARQHFDLAAVRQLDKVRIADLTQSRENLSRPASHTGLVH